MSESSEVLGPIRVPSESGRKAYFRRHQSHYREKRLGKPAGTDWSGRRGNLLPNSELEDRTGLNFFLDPSIVEYVKARTAEVSRAGGTIEEDRLWRNMLSSMPLCFNLFGRLRQRPDIARRILRLATFADIETIDLLEVEWPERHLGDKTAFDAYVEYTKPSGRRGFIGIETKYTETFGRQRISDRNMERYRQAASTLCTDVPADDQLKRQVWRNVLLAGAHLSASARFDEGVVLVITLSDDREALREIAGVRAYLKNPRFLSWTSYDVLLAELDETEASEWAKEFRARYLPPVPYSLSSRASAEREPTEFDVRIGGFRGPFYSIKWTGSALLYEGHEGVRESAEIHVNPTPQQWQTFWRRLGKLNFWDWPDSFGANAVDGTWWSAAITVGARRKKSEGVNAYPPDGKGADPTPEFRRFCRAVSDLVGADFR